uniref:hypothetical protein n=1 Tax=Halomicronema sp. CCY15110 TaxID=2767773 RepID=UPI00194E9AF7
VGKLIAEFKRAHPETRVALRRMDERDIKPQKGFVGPELFAIATEQPNAMSRNITRCGFGRHGFVLF